MFGRHHKDNEEKQIDSSYSDSTYAEGGRDPYEKSSNYNKNSTGYSDSTYSEGGRGSYEKSSAYDTNTGYSEGGGRGRQGYENTTGYGSGGGYEKSSYSTDEPSSYEKKSSNYSETGIGSDASQVDYEKEEKHHSKLEHLGELGTAAAGAFGLHEKDRAEKDPEHGHKHKIEEEVAGAAAVGSGGYAFHEHHEKKEAKEEEEEAHGKKHHHIF